MEKVELYISNARKKGFGGMEVAMEGGEDQTQLAAWDVVVDHLSTTQPAWMVQRVHPPHTEDGSVRSPPLLQVAWDLGADGGGASSSEGAVVRRPRAPSHGTLTRGLAQDAASVDIADTLCDLADGVSGKRHHVVGRGASMLMYNQGGGGEDEESAFDAAVEATTSRAQQSPRRRLRVILGATGSVASVKVRLPGFLLLLPLLLASLLFPWLLLVRA